MVALFQKKNNDKPSAKVVDGKLVLSLTNAIKPTVWQMDFAQIKASALEVSENDNAHILTIRNPKGDQADIARFEKREDAIEALKTASVALENPFGSGDYKTTSAKPKRWVAPMLAVLFLFLLFILWASLTPIPPASLNQAGAPSSAASQTGVPMSADAFLSAQ